MYLVNWTKPVLRMYAASRWFSLPLEKPCVLQFVSKWKRNRQKKPYVSLGCEMLLALVCLLVSWPTAQCYDTGVSLWKRCERVNGVGEFSMIKTLCFTLFFASEDFVCFRRLGMQHNLFVMLLYRFLMVRFFNKCLWPYLHLPVTCFI